MYRYARIWVDEVSASYAALGSVFLGSLGMLVYQSGQINTTAAAALMLNAVPYFYRWLRNARFSCAAEGGGHRVGGSGGAPRHHDLRRRSCLRFRCCGWRSLDRDDADRRRERASAGGVLGRAVVFAVLAIGGVVLVLLPYWMALLKNPINQMPIPHGSRDNFMLKPMSGINFFIIPMGAMILAIAVHRHARSGGAPSAAAAVRLVSDRDPRIGRHHSGRQAAAGPRLSRSSPSNASPSGPR